MPVPNLADVQPYLTLIGTALSVTTLGFVLSLAKAMTDAAKAKAEVMEERLKRSAEEASRLEKWAERHKAEQEEEVSRLRKQLSSAGIDSTFDTNDAASRISREVKESLEMQLKEVSAALSRQNSDSEDTEASLQLGRGYMATGQWALAADYLRRYLRSNPTDFEGQLAIGVAYVNMREGFKTDLAALRAYNEAIAFAPIEYLLSTNSPLSARLFVYRGSVLKRLGRLEESEQDLKLGLKRATADYELADGTYNLACVLAMQGKTEQVIATLKDARFLRNRKYIAKRTKAHLNDYFKTLAMDEEFLRLLGELD